MQRADSLEKTLGLGKIEGRMTEDEMVDGITDSTGMSLSKLWDLAMGREAWHAAVYGVTKSRTQRLNNSNLLKSKMPHKDVFS